MKNRYGGFMSRKVRSIKSLQEQLSCAMVAGLPDGVVDACGYVGHFRQNLLPAVLPADFESDLRQGDGNELESKFRALHSSSALAVNCFAPFKRHLCDLEIAGYSGFETLEFEKKCPTGLRSRRAPNLDVVCQSPDQVLGIESKFTEYFHRKKPKFSAAYEAEIIDERRGHAWFREMVRLQETPNAYGRLDAAQLIKHAFGLAHSYSGAEVILVYLYWEPEMPFAHPLFQQHRNEIAEFSDRIAGSGPRFVALNYQSLWHEWAMVRANWLVSHRKDLLNRYAVDLSA